MSYGKSISHPNRFSIFSNEEDVEDSVEEEFGVNKISEDQDEIR